MNYYKLTLFLIIFSSCSISKTKNQEKENWKFAFKSNTMCSCLKYSGVTIEKDATPSVNFQTLGDFNIISLTDSLGKKYSKKIEEKSIWMKGGDLDGYKAIVNGCLIFYNSSELDSIAENKYLNNN